MNTKSKINAYLALFYGKRILLSLGSVLALVGVAALMISKSADPKDIQITEVIAHMVSFRPRESQFGTSFSIQVELENGTKSGFHSDYIGIYEPGGAVLLRQTKNLRTGKIRHLFLQRIKPNPNQ